MSRLPAMSLRPQQFVAAEDHESTPRFKTSCRRRFVLDPASFSVGTMAPRSSTKGTQRLRTNAASLPSQATPQSRP
jgi:hypothetical protein